MALNSIKNALLTIGPPVFHYFATGQKAPYIIWKEDSQGDSLYADGEMQEQVIQGTVHYFTRTENDPNVVKIQDALNGVCSWRLNSVQCETDTKLIHHEWIFEVV